MEFHRRLAASTWMTWDFHWWGKFSSPERLEKEFSGVYEIWVNNQSSISQGGLVFPLPLLHKYLSNAFVTKKELLKPFFSAHFLPARGSRTAHQHWHKILSALWKSLRSFPRCARVSNIKFFHCEKIFRKGTHCLSFCKSFRFQFPCFSLVNRSRKGKQTLSAPSKHKYLNSFRRKSLNYAAKTKIKATSTLSDTAQDMFNVFLIRKFRRK